MQKKISLISVLALMVLVGLASGITGTFQTRWSELLKLDTGVLGLFFSIQTLISVITAILVGVFVDKFKLLPFLLAGIMSGGLGIFTIVQPGSPSMLLIGLILTGIGMSLMVMISSTWIARNYKDRSNAYFGALNFIFSISAILSPVILNALVAPSNIQIFFSILAFVLILALFIQKFIDELPRIKEEQKTIPRKLLISNRVLIGIGLGALAYAGLEGGIASWIVRYNEALPKSSTPIFAQANTWIMYFYIFHTVGRLIFTFLSNSINPRKYLLVAGIILIPLGLLWLILPADLNLLLVNLAIIGLICSAIFPIFQIILSKKIKYAMGFGSGWITVFSGLGGIIWPSIIGFMFLYNSYLTLPIVFLIAIVLFGLSTILLLPRKPKNAD